MRGSMGPLGYSSFRKTNSLPKKGRPSPRIDILSIYFQYKMSMKIKGGENFKANENPRLRGSNLFLLADNTNPSL